ncbi:trypsin-like serine peptidase [Streptomyces sp. 8N706]|uniref:trypsin-like serine peptidase n=1 Tax=Streptomyces sp. 8N706 TaxID=3457416 RepID=UPI003FD457B8
METSNRVRTEQARHAEAAAERYRRTSAERHEIERRQRAGVAFPDSPESLAARTARLLDRYGVPVAAVVESIRKEEPLKAPDAFERILGVSKELQAWSFLPRGARAARTIARISVRENGRELPMGTGFLVSPKLMMTNHHVLPDRTAAEQSFVEFDAQVTIDNTPGAATRLELDPAALFIADERLDFALVAVRPGGDNRPPGEVFGWNRLSVQTGKLVVGEPVNVIGHPMGRLKEIAVRDNALQVRLDDFLHYRTDTEPGNSGSPVFNDQWEVVALHHSGVPRTDSQGRVLRRDGQVWQHGDGDDAIDWVSNEGVRISSILRHLAALPPESAPRALLAEMGPEAGLLDGVPAPQTAAGPVVPGPAEAHTYGAPSAAALSSAAPSSAAPPSAAPSSAAPSTAASRPAGEAVAAPSGLAARATAFGGRRRLVFLHGRNQQNRIPEHLRRTWAAGLNHGLTEAGLTPIDPADAWFPYYGNTLVRALERQEAVPHPFEGAMVAPAEAGAPASASAKGLYEQLISEAAVRAGMPADDRLATERLGWGDAVGALQRRLSWLASRTSVDEWSIALFFRDVASYLDDQRVRDEVLNCVLATMPTSGELLLVSHSLGTVVAMDLITRLAPELDISLLVTAGSPLGMNTVYSRLLVGGPKRPERVARWLNAWCPTDAVAIGSPLGDDWKGELTELAVANARDRPHHIDEYLAHPEVARVIGGSLAT